MSDWSHEVDFISVGGGIGGVTGALIAHDAGLEALVLEKSPQIGGVAALSLGQIWAPANHLAKQENLPDSAADGCAYMEWVGGGFADVPRIKTYVRWAPGVVKYLGDHAGVAWRLWRGQPDYYFPDAPGSRAEGRALEVEPFMGSDLGEWSERTRVSQIARVTNEERAHGALDELKSSRLASDARTQGGGLAAYLSKAAIGRAIEMRTNATVLSLVKEGSRVGVTVRDADGQTHAIRARSGVLLATSGYDWSPELVRSFDPRTEPASLTMREITGDHLRMAGLLGARVIASSISPQWIDHRLATGGRLERINTSVPGVIMVDRHGSRFADESFGPSFTAALAHIDVKEPRLAHQPFWAIFDDEFRRANPIGNRSSDDPLPPEIITADSLDELGRLTGIDPDGLAQEVSRFNAEAAVGSDPRFGRGTRASTLWKGQSSSTFPTIGPLGTPPYHAAPLITASIGIPVAGLAADLEGRVLDWDGQPMDGLYVAGNSMALTEAGIGYQSGYANTRSLVFGALAALHSAGRDPESLGIEDGHTVK